MTQIAPRPAPNATSLASVLPDTALVTRRAPLEQRGISLKVLAEASNQKPTTSVGGEALKLVEIYNSVKGEGTQAGVPMTFVRFAGCNLACDFCDTPYNRVAITMTEDRLLHQILAQEPAWVIFTGGEPTLQLRRTLTSRLKEAGIRMAIETNGMVWTDAFLDLDYINVSPKTVYDTPSNPIPPDKILAPKLVAAAQAGTIQIDEVRFIITHPSDDIFPLPVMPKSITISPLMHDPEPLEAFVSGKGHNGVYGMVNQAALNRCMELVWKYRHLNARLSVQVHKFVGVR